MLSNIILCKVFRRNEVSEYYFNVTVMRHGSERTTSFPFPASANGRHLITTRRSGWTILNTYAESGSLYVERDARESQLLHMSRSHEFEEQGQLCVLAGDLILLCARCSDASTATTWTWCRGPYPSDACASLVQLCSAFPVSGPLLVANLITLNIYSASYVRC